MISPVNNPRPHINLSVMCLQNLIGAIAIAIALWIYIFIWLPLFWWDPAEGDIYKFLPKVCAQSFTKWAIAKQYPLIFVNPIDDIHAHSAGSHWGHGIEFSFQVSCTNGPLKLRRADLYHLIPLISDSEKALQSTYTWLKRNIDYGSYTKCYFLPPQYAEDFAKGGIKVYMNNDETRAWVYSPMTH